MNIDRFKDEYPVLFTVSIIFKVTGILVIAIAFIAFFYGISLLRYDRELGLYMVASSLFCVFFISIPYFAFAELIKLFVRMEFNTRKENEHETFKRSDNIRHQNKSVVLDDNEISFEDWKRDNPNKSINEYYALKKKK